MRGKSANKRRRRREGELQLELEGRNEVELTFLIHNVSITTEGIHQPLDGWFRMSLWSTKRKKRRRKEGRERNGELDDEASLRFSFSLSLPHPSRRKRG